MEHPMINDGILKLAYGQEAYTPDAGKIPVGTIVLCGLCGDKCNETRNEYGPRSYAMSMLGSKSHYDCWLCSNREARWHIQAQRLRREARNSPSATIERILLEEMEQVIKTRKQTKENVYP